MFIYIFFELYNYILYNYNIIKLLYNLEKKIHYKHILKTILKMTKTHVYKNVN